MHIPTQGKHVNKKDSFPSSCTEFPGPPHLVHSASRTAWSFCEPSALLPLDNFEVCFRPRSNSSSSMQPSVTLLTLLKLRILHVSGPDAHGVPQEILWLCVEKVLTSKHRTGGMDVGNEGRSGVAWG